MAETFKNAKIISVGITATVLYTAPALTASVLHAVYLNNIDGANSVSVTIEIFDSSDSGTVVIAKDILIPAGNDLVLEKQINLETGDRIDITASDASRLSAFASILEITA